jgi:hypothetical protein
MDTDNYVHCWWTTEPIKHGLVQMNQRLGVQTTLAGPFGPVTERNHQTTHQKLGFWLPNLKSQLHPLGPRCWAEPHPTCSPFWTVDSLMTSRLHMVPVPAMHLDWLFYCNLVVDDHGSFRAEGPGNRLHHHMKKHDQEELHDGEPWFR